MAPPLFLSPAALPSLRTRARTNANTCVRRLRHSPFVCSATPSDPGETGDPSWMDLARSLGASDAEPERTAPEWKLPDDQPLSTDNDGKSAWAAWNAAASKGDGPAPQRDPRKETDFWRSAARDMPTPSGEETLEQDATLPQEGETAAADEANSSTDIWRMARGVTGEMSSLQERLRIDLENFNPDENTDQYRDIARELVGPPDEPGDNVDPVRAAEGEKDPTKDKDASQDAEAGSGWNPDVDWMRFEDIRREQAKQVESDERKQAAQDAQAKKFEAIDRFAKDSGAAGAQSQEGITFTDESGRVLTPEEVELARREGAVFVDEAGAHIDASKAGDQLADQASPSTRGTENISVPDGKVPGFMTSKFKSGTFGSGYEGMEEDMKAIQEQGIPLRDPKADAERRSAARELDINVDELDAVDTTSSDSKAADDILAATPGGDMTDVASKVIHESDDSAVEECEESSPWSQWREGTKKWEKVVKSAKPRDPKAEIDMWRSSAREITADDHNSSAPAAEGTVKGSSEGMNAWDNWRSADATWKTGVAKADESSTEKQSANNPWVSKESKSDWGAGLDGKATSDRTAWENWNSVNGDSVRAGMGSSLWWPSESDSGTRGNSAKRISSANNVDQWRSAAVELGGYNVNPSPEEVLSKLGESQPQRMKQDPILNFWKDVAKGITDGNAVDGVENRNTED